MIKTKSEYCEECGARNEKLTQADGGMNAFCEECLDKKLESKDVFECVECHEFYSDMQELSECEDDKVCCQCYANFSDYTEELWAGYHAGL